MTALTKRSLTKRFSLVMFLFALALAFPMGVNILFIMGRGITLFEVGALVAIQAITVVVLELPTGGLADVWGRKKVLLLAFSVGTAGGVVLLASFSFVGFLAAAVINGACMALFSGTMEAMFVDELKAVDPEANLQEYMGPTMMMQGLGMALGAVLGGFIPRWFAGLPDEGTAVLTPLAMPLVVSLGFFLLTFLAAATLLTERAQGERRPPSDLQGLRAVVDVMSQALKVTFKNRMILLLISSSSLYAFAFSTVESFWQPHFASLQQSQELDTRAFGVMFALTLVFGAIGNGLAGVVTRWTGERYALVCAVAVCLLVAGLFVMSLQTTWVAAMVSFWFVYLASGLAIVAFQGIYNSTIPSDKRATLVSFQSLALRAGGFVGGLGLGYVAHNFSIPLAWRCGALALLAVVPLFLYIERVHGQIRMASEPSDEGPAGSPSPLPEPSLENLPAQGA